MLNVRRFDCPRTPGSTESRSSIVKEVSIMSTTPSFDPARISSLWKFVGLQSMIRSYFSPSQSSQQLDAYILTGAFCFHTPDDTLLNIEILSTFSSGFPSPVTRSPMLSRRRRLTPPCAVSITRSDRDQNSYIDVRCSFILTCDTKCKLLSGCIEMLSIYNWK